MRELPLVLKTLVENVSKLQTLPLPQWEPDKPNQEDLQVFQKEAFQDSIFDPLKLRRNLWEAVDSGGGTIQCMSCSYAKVLWIQEKGSDKEPPWNEWGRIFQWLGHAPHGMKWRVFWFPARIQRILPKKGEEVTSKHLNGGYCYPCNPNVIVIYRLEEATRVLIHEVLHAACTDPKEAELPIKEATTETWAELFLVAICSKGNMNKAKYFWHLQSSWIANQNETLKKFYNVKTMDDFAWRYTVGREYILESLHIRLPTITHPHGSSSRLTHPKLCL